MLASSQLFIYDLGLDSSKLSCSHCGIVLSLIIGEHGISAAHQGSCKGIANDSKSIYRNCISSLQSTMWQIKSDNANKRSIYTERKYFYDNEGDECKAQLSLRRRMPAGHLRGSVYVYLSQTRKANKGCFGVQRKYFAVS